jgi:hypothetical protein
MLGRHHVSAECINPMLINLGSNFFYASKINGQWFGRCGNWVAENSQDVFTGLINKKVIDHERHQHVIPLGESLHRQLQNFLK